MIEMSIVTGTRHRPESLKRFMDSILATASVTTEVIIADASDELLPLNHPLCDVVHVDHFHEKPRLGTVKGYNVAFRRAEGRYVTWFNDDCTLLKGWDRTAVDFMDNNPEVGLGAIYWRDPGGSWYLQTFQNMVYPNFGVFRREVGEKTGWFDEREVFIAELDRMESLVFYGNDTSAAFLVTDAGYAVCGIPGCKVEHHREQDAERHANNQKYVHGPQGNIAGQVLFHLWGGTAGYERLREKYNHFKHLHAPITCE